MVPIETVSRTRGKAIKSFQFVYETHDNQETSVIKAVPTSGEAPVNMSILSCDVDAQPESLNGINNQREFALDISRKFGKPLTFINQNVLNAVLAAKAKNATQPPVLRRSA